MILPVFCEWGLTQQLCHWTNIVRQLLAIPINAPTVQHLKVLTVYLQRYISIINSSDTSTGGYKTSNNLLWGKSIDATTPGTTLVCQGR
jgi:hypothetical protein